MLRIDNIWITLTNGSHPGKKVVPAHWRGQDRLNTHPTVLSKPVARRSSAKIHFPYRDTLEGDRSNLSRFRAIGK
jgi:hypothetical protein